MDKREILHLVIEFLKKEEQQLIDAALSAKEAATESEAKPENQYDTRGLEQSYLAAGQAKRASDLKITIQNFSQLQLVSFDDSMPIDISALVELENELGQIKIYFLLPQRGGIKIKYKKDEILTLSPDSPLGDKLLGKKVGETIEIKTAGANSTLVILKVR